MRFLSTTLKLPRVDCSRVLKKFSFYIRKLFKPPDTFCVSQYVVCLLVFCFYALFI